MPNLEVLHLCANVFFDDHCVDENYLEKSLFPRLPKLKNFTSFIQSYVPLSPDQLTSSFREQVEQSSFRSPEKQMVFYGDYFPEARKIQYHFYTSTSLNKSCNGLSNRFPGDRFNHVRRVSLYDEKPFEHEFFLRIHQSFPLLEELSMKNSKAQQHCQKADQTTSAPITYTSLDCLTLRDVHDDYLEEFLLQTKTIFHRQLTLWTNHESLKRVTNNFTIDQLRMNTKKVIKLFLYGIVEFSVCLEEYFSQAKIVNASKNVSRVFVSYVE